jgi:hypothetical protein
MLSLMPAQTAAQGGMPPAPAAVAQADSLLDLGEFEAAAEAYRAVVATNPKDGESAYLLGYALQTLEQWDEAVAPLSLAVEYRPRRARALYRLAGSLAQLGSRDSAMVVLNAAIDAGLLQTGMLASDETLDPLRDRPDFRRLLQDQFGPYYTDPASNRPPTVAEMEAGIARLTSTIRSVHPNPYRYVSPSEWDRREAEALRRVRSATETQYLVELMSLASSVGDVHTSVYPSGDSPVMRTAMPVQFWKFSDGLRIRAASPEHRELLGATVLAIGGVPVEDAWSGLIARFPNENEWMSAYMMQFFMRFPQFLTAVGLGSDEAAGSLRLRLADGTVHDVTLPGEDRGGYGAEMSRTLGFQAPEEWVEGHDAAAPPRWLAHRDRAYWFQVLPERDAVYLQFNTSRDDPAHPWSPFLTSLADTLRATGIERIVIDLRHNGGGWHYMAYDLATALRAVPQLAGPGHVGVLIGRLVQSAGVTIAAVLEREADAVFVGEPVGAHPNFYNGRWGNHPPLALPGTRLRFRVSTIPEPFSDALDDRRFIALDHWVRLRYDDYAAGKDPVLAAALNLTAEDAVHFLSDPGGRPIAPYFRWRRPSQDVAWPSFPRQVP